jgi:hypothetical protein
MSRMRAFLKHYRSPRSIAGWRGVPFLGFVVAITIALPEAQALLLGGITGGIVIGAFLILIRHQFRSGGPRRGTPIVLFPKPAEWSATGA